MKKNSFVVIALLATVFAASHADGALFGLFHKKVKPTQVTYNMSVTEPEYFTNVTFWSAQGGGTGLKFFVTETRNVGREKNLQNGVEIIHVSTRDVTNWFVADRNENCSPEPSDSHFWDAAMATGGVPGVLPAFTPEPLPEISNQVADKDSQFVGYPYCGYQYESYPWYGYGNSLWLGGNLCFSSYPDWGYQYGPRGCDNGGFVSGGFTHGGQTCAGGTYGGGFVSGGSNVGGSIVSGGSLVSGGSRVGGFTGGGSSYKGGSVGGGRYGSGGRH